MKRRDLVFGAWWVAATAIGEAIGMTAAALLGAFVAPLVLSPDGGGVASFALASGAGAIEGAILGGAQLACMFALKRDASARWIGATAIGMALGWLAATLATAPFETAGGGAGRDILLAGVSGVVLGASIGAAQWLSKRRLSPAWIAINAVAWPPALLVSYFGASAIEYGDWRAVHFVSLAITGAIVGAIVGAFTAQLAARA